MEQTGASGKTQKRKKPVKAWSVGIGAMHHHPHTQITYVASGRFRFTIGDEVKEVGPGDTLCKQNDIVHGCECLEAGVLVDFFTPMRKDFLKD